MNCRVVVIGSGCAKEQLEQSLRSEGIGVDFYDALEDFGISPGAIEPVCVLLLDPSTLSSIQALRVQFPLSQRLVVVEAEEAALALSAMKVPGTEVHCRPCDPEELLAHIRSAVLTCKRKGRKVGSSDDLRSRFASLSSREFEVMELVARGVFSKQIANMLLISVRTVESHRANILRKTSARNTVELVRLFGAYQSLTPVKRS